VNPEDLEARAALLALRSRPGAAPSPPAADGAAPFSP
jgi:hypothetical protein